MVRKRPGNGGSFGMGTIAIMEVHQRLGDLELGLPRKSLLAVSVVNTSPRHNHVLMQRSDTIISDLGEGILNGECPCNAKAEAIGGVSIVPMPIDEIFDLGLWLGANC